MYVVDLFVLLATLRMLSLSFGNVHPYCAYLRLASNQYGHGAYGNCYFWTLGLPIATYEAAIEGCRQQRFGAQLAIFPDTQLIGPIFDELEPNLVAACPASVDCTHIRVGAARSFYDANGTLQTVDDWKWILADGSLSTVPLNYTGPGPHLTSLFIIASSRVFASASFTHGGHPYLCSSSLKWQGKQELESNSSVIQVFEGIIGKMHCAEKCRLSLACLSFTQIDTSAICRLHWKTVRDGLLVTGNVQAVIYEIL